MGHPTSLPPLNDSPPPPPLSDSPLSLDGLRFEWLEWFSRHLRVLTQRVASIHLHPCDVLAAPFLHIYVFHPLFVQVHPM